MVVCVSLTPLLLFVGELEMSEQQLQKSGAELLNLRQQLSAANQMMTERASTVSTLQGTCALLN